MPDNLETEAAKAAKWMQGHTVRISFEGVALAVIILVVLVACLIGFKSQALADRVHQLADDIVKLLGVLGITVGGSWGTSVVHKGIEAFGGKKDE